MALGADMGGLGRLVKAPDDGTITRLEHETAPVDAMAADKAAGTARLDVRGRASRLDSAAVKERMDASKATQRLHGSLSQRLAARGKEKVARDLHEAAHSPYEGERDQEAVQAEAAAREAGRLRFARAGQAHRRGDRKAAEHSHGEKSARGKWADRAKDRAAAKTAAKRLKGKAKQLRLRFANHRFLVAFAGVAVAFGLVASAAMLVMALVAGIAGSQTRGSLDGFPPYITNEMVEAAIECQEKWGHPAGATIAQIIVESGQGDSLSGLATRDMNLFGIKWSESHGAHPEVVGYGEWATSEEYVPGSITQITARFTKFKSHRDCIFFRSRVFLQGSRYAGNALIREAIATHSSDKMAEGLKDAGWATSSTYVSHLKAVLAEYNLYALDTMTLEQWRKRMQGGQDLASANEAQKRIVAACWSTPSPPSNLCATWVSRVYANAGYSYVGGNACDMYYAYCNSSDRSQLKVGMMVAVPHSPFGSAGMTYGHIGIYVGDGKVMHSTGVIQTTDLDTWISTYAYNCQARWGYPFPGIG